MNDWIEADFRHSCNSNAVRLELERKECLAKARAGKIDYNEFADKALAGWYMYNNLAGCDRLNTPERLTEHLNEIKAYDYSPMSVSNQETFRKEYCRLCDQLISTIEKTHLPQTTKKDGAP